MAIFHIITVDHTHADPVKDQRGCYKAGDIVTVDDDTAHDGDIVKNPIRPRCVVVKVRNMTRAEGKVYAQPQWDLTDPDRPVVVRRRLYYLNLAALPAAIKNQLEAGRYVEVLWNSVRSYVINKQTGQGQ